MFTYIYGIQVSHRLLYLHSPTIHREMDRVLRRSEERVDQHAAGLYAGGHDDIRPQWVFECVAGVYDQAESGPVWTTDGAECWAA